jgi:hypothetical protein
MGPCLASNVVPNVASNTRARRRKRRVVPAFDIVAGLPHADPAKAFVLTYLAELIAGGHAEWHLLGNGDIQFVLHSGEVFLLAATTVVRIA